eukprot:jgi/Mesvir1/23855/Mv10656-RA.1
MPPPTQRPGDAAFATVEKINAEVFTLTYGAVVRQLMNDFEDPAEVNKQLDKMGYNIGIRLVDEFLAKGNINSKCKDFKETMDIIAKVGFKMFLGVNASVSNWSADGSECHLSIEDNPMISFVELPEQCRDLHYCNILCGVLRGALEMVNIKVECYFVKDELKGDPVTEMRLKLLEITQDEYPFKNDE